MTSTFSDITLRISIQSQVNTLKSIYGKIRLFPKKANTFETWKCGETFEMIAREAIYVTDAIAREQGNEELHQRILDEPYINQEKFEVVKESLTRSGNTLREIGDLTSLRYNQIRAVIAVLINGYQL